MTALQIDIAATAGAQRQLRAAGEGLDGAERAVNGAATLAALAGEQSAVLALLAATNGQLEATWQLFAFTSDAARAADLSFEMLGDGRVAQLVQSLRDQMNDDDGTSVVDLIQDGTLDLDTETLAALTLDGAREWFDALPESARIEILAVRREMLAGTPAQHVAQAWQDQLDADQLRELFTMRALANAGIDPTQWDPTLGVDHNAPIVESVYEYYAELYRNDPDRLWWAGMAALIGPSFYGGFQDFETFADVFEFAADVHGGPIGAVLPGGPSANQAIAMGEDWLADDLRWYQVQLLAMQEEIFYDMAPAHEAYLDGGLEMIERLYANDPYGFGEETILAWEAIDVGWQTGSVDAIAAGNKLLLLREQAEVIADDYDRMRERPLTGELVTWTMTAIGTPSVPGAQSYPDVFPLTLEVGASVRTPDKIPEPPLLGPFLPDVPLPHIDVGGSVEIETPFPDGNIAGFEDRWALIEADTLPVYVDLAQHHPEVILEILETPVGERAEEYTIQERWDEILADLTTDWNAGVDLELGAGW